MKKLLLDHLRAVGTLIPNHINGSPVLKPLGLQNRVSKHQIQLNFIINIIVISLTVSIIHLH